MSDHYLLSYQSAMVAVLRTQLGDRGLEQGVEGCLALAQSIDLKKLLPLADMKLTAAENARLKEVMDASGANHARRYENRDHRDKVEDALCKYIYCVSHGTCVSQKDCRRSRRYIKPGREAP